MTFCRTVFNHFHWAWLVQFRSVTQYYLCSYDAVRINCPVCVITCRRRHLEHHKPSLLQHVTTRPLRKFEGLHDKARHQSLTDFEMSHLENTESEDISYAAAHSTDEYTATLLHSPLVTSATQEKPHRLARKNSRSSIASTLSHHSAHAPDPMHSKLGLRLCRQFRYLRGLQYILLFSYESLTEQAMQIVNCISVGSCGRVLAAYPAVSCLHNPAYFPLVTVGICILVYAVLFPMGMWYFLRKHCGCGGGGYEANPNNIILLAKYGVLYDHFKPNFWWWEVQVRTPLKFGLRFEFVFVHRAMLC